MIYVICRNRDEIKYEIPNDAKIIINECEDNFFGEIAAWEKIYKDAKNNGYKTVGIYQARRAFHENMKILSDNDYDISKNEFYATEYPLNNDTLYSQYVKGGHFGYETLLDKVLPDNLLKISKEIHFIYPHNMFYTSFTTFEKMMEFLFSFIPVVQQYKKDEMKIFSFFAERLITLFLLSEHIKVCNVKCCRFNKITGEADAMEYGLGPWKS